MKPDTKTALLDSAERAVRARGFDGFSYADLSADVGIRKASIHHHFATKAALSVALMDRYADQMQATCVQITHDNRTAGGQLRAMIAHYRTALGKGETLCLCVAFSSSRDSLSNDTIIRIRTFRAKAVDWLTGVFEQGQSDGSIGGINDPRAEAQAALALLEGAQLGARTARQVGLFDGATQLLASRVMPSG